MNIETFNRDALNHSLSYLSLPTLVHLRSVSKRFQKLSDEHSIWKHFCQRDFNGTTEKNEKSSITYRRCHTNNWKLFAQTRGSHIGFLDFEGSDIMCNGDDLRNSVDIFSQVDGQLIKKSTVSFNGEFNFSLIRHNQLFVTGSNSQIHFWDFQGKCLKSLEHDEVDVTSLAQQNSILVSGSDNGQIRIWDIEKSTFRTLSGHLSEVNCLVIDNNELISGTGYIVADKSIRLWDLRTEHSSNIFQHQDGLLNLARTGNEIIIGTDGGTTICDKRKFQAIHYIPGTWSPGIAVSGNKLLSSAKNVLRITHLKTFETKKIMSFTQSITEVKRQGDQLLVGLVREDPLNSLLLLKIND